MDLIPSIRLRLLRLQNLPENRKQKNLYNVHISKIILTCKWLLVTPIHFDVTMYVQKKYFVEKKAEIVVSF